MIKDASKTVLSQGDVTLLIFLEIKHIFWPLNLFSVLFIKRIDCGSQKALPNHKTMQENLTLLNRASRRGNAKRQSQEGFLWRTPVPPAVCPVLFLNLMLQRELHGLIPGWSVSRTSLPFRWIYFPLDPGTMWGSEVISCQHPVPPCVEGAWALWFGLCCLNLQL